MAIQSYLHSLWLVGLRDHALSKLCEINLSSCGMHPVSPTLWGVFAQLHSLHEPFRESHRRKSSEIADISQYSSPREFSLYIVSLQVQVKILFNVSVTRASVFMCAFICPCVCTALAFSNSSRSFAPPKHLQMLTVGSFYTTSFPFNKI